MGGTSRNQGTGKGTGLEAHKSIWGGDTVAGWGVQRKVLWDTGGEGLGRGGTGHCRHRDPTWR